jgi:diaminopimelate epimerase
MGRTFAGAYVRAGVPHFVTPVDDLAGVPIAEWGRAVRRHAAFGDEGANVDFVAPRDGGVAMRTYERGVEGETLACGSGAIASAVWAVAGGARSPVVVRTAGGDALEVSLRDAGVRYDVTLTGPAEVAFTGTLDEA